MTATENYYLARVKELESALDSVQKELVLGLESLEAQVREMKKEKAQLLARVSYLEMELDLARSKAMGKE